MNFEKPHRRLDVARASRCRRGQAISLHSSQRVGTSRLVMFANVVVRGVLRLRSDAANGRCRSPAEPVVLDVAPVTT